MLILVVSISLAFVAVGFIMPYWIGAWVNRNRYEELEKVKRVVNEDPITTKTTVYSDYYVGHHIRLDQFGFGESMGWDMYVDNKWVNCVHYDYEAAFKGLRSIAEKYNTY